MDAWNAQQKIVEDHKSLFYTYSLSNFWHQACKTTNYFLISVSKSW